MQTHELKESIAFEPATPLRHRVPTEDSDGTPLSDLMILIPRLKYKPQRLIARRLAHIEAVLVQFQDRIVFAELNINLNILWLSVKQTSGICIELTSAIKAKVPEAVLVGHPGHF